MTEAKAKSTTRGRARAASLPAPDELAPIEQLLLRFALHEELQRVMATNPKMRAGTMLRRATQRVMAYRDTREAQEIQDAAARSALVRDEAARLTERHRLDPAGAEATARRMARVAVEMWRERRAELRGPRDAVAVA